jgi:hypothetical protein
MAAFPFPSPFPVLELAVVASDFLVFLEVLVLVASFFQLFRFLFLGTVFLNCFP